MKMIKNQKPVPTPASRVKVGDYIKVVRTYLGQNAIGLENVEKFFEVTKVNRVTFHAVDVNGVEFKFDRGDHFEVMTDKP